MKYAVITAPEKEPVALEDAKAHLRLLPGDDTEDEAVLMPIISAAREYCENITGRTLAAKTVEAYPDGFSLTMRLPHTPLTAVTGIRYKSADGNETVMPESDYSVDLLESMVIIHNIPTFEPYPTNQVTITYEAGYAPEKVPKTIRQAMLLLIGHWHTNREAVVVGAIAAVEVPLSVKRLLDQWKVWWY